MGARGSCRYTDNLAPDPAMFNNEVLLGHDALNKVYKQLIMALNEVRIKKNTGSTLSVLWNGKSQNTCIGQVNADLLWLNSMTLNYLTKVSITLALIFGHVMIF